MGGIVARLGVSVAWQLRSLTFCGKHLSAMGQSGLLGSRWLSWIRPINIATVEEQQVLIAAGRHLAASVVGNRGRENLVLFFHFGGCLSKAVG